MANKVFGVLCIPPNPKPDMPLPLAKLPTPLGLVLSFMSLRMGLLAASILSALDPCLSGPAPGALPVSSSVRLAFLKA